MLWKFEHLGSERGGSPYYPDLPIYTSWNCPHPMWSDGGLHTVFTGANIHQHRGISSTPCGAFPRRLGDWTSVVVSSTTLRESPLAGAANAGVSKATQSGESYRHRSKHHRCAPIIIRSTESHGGRDVPTSNSR